ncbi:MAG TPA: NAD(P)-dependent oxidoreductase [Candidatus Acidoferrum sp.]|nr:NAD(P)-dependent oxidoreductase [Candidatus Acidoferrum sp.]
MIKLLLTDAHLFTGEQLEEIRAMGYDMDTVSDRAQLSPDAAQKYEAVMAYGLFKHTPLPYFTNLKMVHSVATGVEAMPVAELAARGIPLYKGKDLYSIPMAEWVICKLLEALKRAREMACLQQAHIWRKRSWAFTDGALEELYGKSVLIVGAGDIGRALASMLRAFEVAEIAGVNTTGRQVAEFDRCVRFDALDCELPKADIVVITCPLTEATYHLFDAKRLDLIREDGILVNVSRGKLIDEGALVEKLTAGGLAWFISDVFETEPLPKESPLWEMENVLITPHNSFITYMRPIRMSAFLLKNLAAYAKGEPLEGPVDYQKGY